MIKLKLKDLLETHSLTISEFSTDTGLARSTITPMVNKPNDVKALKLETINVICDYFGVSTDELIEFIPETKKYSVINVIAVDDEKSLIVILKKQLGNTERLCMVYAATSLTPMYFNEDLDDSTIRMYLSCELSVLDKKNVPKRILESYLSSNIISSEVFLKDFERNDMEVQKATTQIIAKYVVNSLLNDDEVKQSEYAQFTWTDFPFFERKTFSFGIESDDGKISKIVYID